VVGFVLSLVTFLYASCGSFCLGTFYLGPYFLDLHKTSTFWGIAVSAVALVITCYFFLLMYDAFKIVKEVSDLKTKLEKELESLDNAKKNFAELTWETYTNQYNLLCKQGKGGSLASGLLRSRGQLGYLFPMLEQKKRIQCFMSDLAKHGTEEDLMPLVRIYADPDVLPKIKASAKYANDAIRARLSPR